MRRHRFATVSRSRPDEIAPTSPAIPALTCTTSRPQSRAHPTGTPARRSRSIAGGRLQQPRVRLGGKFDLTRRIDERIGPGQYQTMCAMGQ